MFSGALDQLESAFNAASSSLRPLSPGSMPPPLCLPPPPAAALSSTGDLVIDQPSFLRQKWPQQKPTLVDANRPASEVGPPPPRPPSMPLATIAEPRVLESCPPQPLPPPDTVLPTFRVKPISREAKHWTPYNQQAPAPAVTPSQQQQQQPVHVSRHMPESGRPVKWQPTETPVIVKSHVEVNLDPEPEPEPVDITTSWPTPPLGRVSLRTYEVEGHMNDVEVVPRWALPLRSEYDWRQVYNLGDSDEWELTDDGNYYIRRSKNHSF